MRKIELSSEQFAYVRRQKDFHPDRLVRRRFHLLFLLHKGYAQNTAADVLDITPKTICQWLDLFFEQGLSALEQLHFRGNRSELEDHLEQIRTDLEAHPVTTLQQACDRIEQITGVVRKRTQVGRFLKNKLGFGRYKDQPLPGGRKDLAQLEAEQQTFLRKKLLPVLRRAARNQCVTLFVDGVHPVQGFHATYHYGPKALCYRTPSGRHRVNLLGALDAVDHTLHAVYEQKYINADSVVQLLEQIKQHYSNKLPIYLILDNARYQKCDSVRRAARRLGIRLLFLPAYSPNLNLIERVWKLMKKVALHAKQFASKESFTQAVHDFVDQFNLGAFHKELESLLTWNFQSIFKTSQKFTFCAG